VSSAGAPLRESDVEHYREHGWLRLGRLFDASTLAELRAEERRFRLDVGYGAASNRNLRVNVQLCERSEPVRRACVAGRQIPMLQQLVGPDLCLTHQQFVTKLPDREGEHSDIPFHQDNGYGRLEPMTDITVWVPLVDTDERNGALRIVPGSHRDGLLEHRRSAVNPVLVEAATGEASLLVGPNGVQILGGHGYMQDYPVEKFMRETRVLGLSLGGADAARDEAGRMFEEEFAPVALLHTEGA